MVSAVTTPYDGPYLNPRWDRPKVRARWPTLLSLLLLTALHTFGNAFKPLHIDDAAYYYYARQASRQPLDPYGFRVFWWHNPEPANEVLAPPLLPYWWALVMRVGGDAPWVWKLGMVPFSVLFIASLYALFRRFARGFEMPLTWLTVLSPTFWPSLNLMLDIPSLALGLCAMVLFMRACDHASLQTELVVSRSPASAKRQARVWVTGGAYGLAAFSGLIAGLAMETKYTAFLIPAAMLLYAVFLGKLRLWPVAALVAAQVFVSWEWLMAVLYGESHFGYHFRPRADSDWLAKLSYLFPMLSILGSLAPALVLLAFRGLRIHAAVLIPLALTCLLGYVLVASIKDEETTRVPLPSALITHEPDAATALPFQVVWFGAWGAVLVALTLAALLILLRFDSKRYWERILRSVPLYGSRLERLRVYFLCCRPFPPAVFLSTWLALEVAGYVALTPFPAVRRLMGVVVVGTLILGCLAARTGRRHFGQAVVWGIVGYGSILGYAFTLLDWRDAQTEQEAVERAAAFIDVHGGGKIWFVGHWGFQFYAERAGMEAVSPTESQLEAGDWLVFPYEVTRQSMDREGIPRELEAELLVDDRIRLQTVMCYYSGYTAVENREGPRVTVSVYRITRSCVPGYRK
jgi:hypothetical protein